LPVNVCPSQAKKLALPEPGSEGYHDKTFVFWGRSPSDERGFTHKGSGSAIAAEAFMKKAGERGPLGEKVSVSLVAFPVSSSSLCPWQTG